MAGGDKLVMQVTIHAEEYPLLFSELRSMSAHKRRASVFTRLAYLGWLFERSGSQLSPAPAKASLGLLPSNPAPKSAAASAVPVGARISDWLDDLAGEGDGSET